MRLQGLLISEKRSQADIRQITGDFEARIALLTGLGNGKSPRHGQQAIEAGG
jgi:hypothetical protein